MFKRLLIKLLFHLLKVDLKTKNIIPFDDLKSIAGERKANEINESFRRQKYIKALAAANNIRDFNEWLYLQVVTKRNDHIRTLDKEKRKAQTYGMLTFLYIIEELREAEKALIKLKK